MNQDKMYLINKLFNDKTIRTVWDKEQEKYFISIVDLVGALSESVRPRKYWSDIKKRLIEEGHNELSEKIGQLKLKSSDGKYYMTDSKWISIAELRDNKNYGRIAEKIAGDLVTHKQG